MIDADVTPTRDSVCPFCGYTMNALGPADPRNTRRPQPGDPAICLQCGGILVFDADVSLRAMSNREWLALSDDDRVDVTAQQTKLRAFNAWRTANPEAAAALEARERARHADGVPADLYAVARETCHDLGIPWTDPRTGVTYPPPAKAKP
jgi:hypothetical protein